MDTLSHIEALRRVAEVHNQAEKKPEAGAEKRLRDVTELARFFQERGINFAEAALVAASAIEVIMHGHTLRVRVEFVPLCPEPNKW